MATKSASKQKLLDRASSRDVVIEKLFVDKGQLEKSSGCRIMVSNTLGMGTAKLRVRLCRKVKRIPSPQAGLAGGTTHNTTSMKQHENSDHNLS